jgi:hypothetical protein
MRQVSDTTRSDSGSDSSSQSSNSGDDSESFARIKSANRKVRLLDFLRHYGLKIEKNYQRPAWSNNIVCPFRSHKGAKERTPSFAYNFIKDYYYCFGCHQSGRAVEFISLYEGVHRAAVADRILSQYGEDLESEDDDYEDHISPVLIECSRYLQTKIRQCKNDPAEMGKVDKIIRWLDFYLMTRAPGKRITAEDLKYRVERVKELI